MLVTFLQIRLDWISELNDDDDDVNLNLGYVLAQIKHSHCELNSPLMYWLPATN